MIFFFFFPSILLLSIHETEKKRWKFIQWMDGFKGGKKNIIHNKIKSNYNGG